MKTKSGNTLDSLSKHNVAIYRPKGRLDTESCQSLRGQAMAIADTKTKVLVIDMRDITYIDSNGLGLLVALLKVMRNSGGRLILCSLNAQAEMLLEFTSTLKLFEVYKNHPDLSVG